MKSISPYEFVAFMAIAGILIDIVWFKKRFPDLKNNILVPTAFFANVVMWLIWLAAILSKGPGAVYWVIFLAQYIIYGWVLSNVEPEYDSSKVYSSVLYSIGFKVALAFLLTH